jgi:hypothetical protein
MSSRTHPAESGNLNGPSLAPWASYSESDPALPLNASIAQRSDEDRARGKCLLQTDMSQ